VGVLPDRPWGHQSATTKGPVKDNGSDDEVSSSVDDIRKEMAPVNGTIYNSRKQMDNMVSYHKFSNRTDQQVWRVDNKKRLCVLSFNQVATIIHFMKTATNI
jgi:hypothetical protein